MEIIPAIDLKEGKCVRLTQGKMEDETIYSTDPVETALKWESMGADTIHLVDLDAAIQGKPVNHNVIKAITEKVKCKVQVGGGIRDIESAKVYLDNEKVRRIIIGTAAYDSPDFFKELCKDYPGRVAVGIDAKDKKVAIKGWVEVTDKSAIELAKELESVGAAALIYTDISRDGMMTGPNLEAMEEMAKAVSIPLIASGGVSNMEDILNLNAITGPTLNGVIVGKAIYAGTVDLKEAFEAVK